MTTINLTPQHGDFAIEDDEIEPLDCRDSFRTPFGRRTTITFDRRVYTIDEFRTWVRRLVDVETSTDPARAHIVEQMRAELAQQQENAAAIVGALSQQTWEQRQEIRRLTAERDALIAERETQT